MRDPLVEFEQLSILQDRRYLPSGRHDYPRPNELVSSNEAYQSLRDFLSNSATDSEDRAHDRLENAWNMNHATPDLFIKIFNDLNELLFDNQLYNRVFLTWEDLPDELLGRTGSRSDCTCCPADRIQIQLDRAMFYEESKSKIWGTLVHEMLHAYMFVVTDHESAHGRDFERACRALGAALGFRGLRGDDIFHEEDD
ncbi:hypothetical protein LTR65_000819 [Meristemomyces frigidus]